MKYIIISGPRDYPKTQEQFNWVINSIKRISLMFNGFKDCTFVLGGATGIDATAKKYAVFFKIPYIEMLAEWSKLGNKAGPIRNQKMAKQGDILVAFYRGKYNGSPGTKNMIQIAYKEKLELHIIQIPD